MRKATDRTYYELLNAHPHATLDELRTNYKQLILQCHPDKLQDNRPPHRIAAVDNDQPNSTGIGCAGAGVGDGARTGNGNGTDVDPIASDHLFVAINTAWNTLKDPVQRKLYDAELLQTKFQAHSNIYERLRLADMERCYRTDSDSDIPIPIPIPIPVDDNVINADNNDVQETTKTNPTTTPVYYYTYNCRCGGQYVVDESEFLNRDCAGNTTAVDGCDDDDDDDEDGDGDGDGDVIVECSECSLVILLSR